MYLSIQHCSVLVFGYLGGQDSEAGILLHSDDPDDCSGTYVQSKYEFFLGYTG